MKRVHLIISGDVHGVGFRAFVLRQAQDLRCVGWVKNREDDSVEVVAEGAKKDLEELISACLAKRDLASQGVKNAVVTWEEATDEFVSFEIVY